MFQRKQQERLESNFIEVTSLPLSTLFFIIEADDLAKGEEFTLSILMMLGSVRVTPVMPPAEVTGRATRIMN